MKFIEKISFEEMMKNWEKREKNYGWDAVAKEKGFGTWREWREYSISLLVPKGTKGKLFLIENVLEEVSKTFIGPYKAWSEKNELPKNPTFSDLKSYCPDFIRNNGRVKEIKKALPFDMEVIILKIGERFFLIDGHHRFSAIIDSENLDWQETKVFAAVFELPSKKISNFYETLERGTQNPNLN